MADGLVEEGQHAAEIGEEEGVEHHEKGADLRCRVKGNLNVWGCCNQCLALYGCLVLFYLVHSSLWLFSVVLFSTSGFMAVWCCSI